MIEYLKERGVDRGLKEMDIQDLFDTPRKIGIFSGSVAFLILFPAYFAWMPLVEDGMISGGSGASGNWEVGFAETPIVLQETQVLGDGDTHDTFFDVASEMSIGYIELDIDCNDNDDPGPGFTDGADGVSDLSGVEGHSSGDIEDQSGNGMCSGGDSGFTLRWDVTANYSGANFTASGLSESEIRETWNDGGLGRGTWAATITADISSPPSPLGSIVDSDEEYEITWTAMTYELVLQPAEEIAA